MAKAKGRSPAELSMEWLRDQGYLYQKVEVWNPFAGKRKDLFDVIDIVAVKAGEPGVLGIQCTTVSNMSEHIHKATKSGKLETWLLAGNRFVLHGWDKRKIKNRWVYRLQEERLTHPDFSWAALLERLVSVPFIRTRVRA